MNAELVEQIRRDPELRRKLYEADYKEVPVHIGQFIDDPYYLGETTGRGTRLYDCWRTSLLEAFSSKTILEVILTGSIGTGKSSCSNVGLAYGLYNVLCLKDPYEYYGLLRGKPLALVFFSMTLSLSDTGNFVMFQNAIQASPWFMERGTLRGKVNPILHFDDIDYKLCSPRASGYGNVGADVIGGVMDELNTPNESVGIKKRAFGAYQSTVRRMESRFMNKGSLRGLKLWLCASRDDELSFLDAHIDQRAIECRNRSLEGKQPHVLVKDVPIYEAKPNNYSGETFPVAVGDAFKDSLVISEDQVDQYAMSGYSIVRLPVEHRDAAINDINNTLKEIAGITVATIRRNKAFPSEDRITEAEDRNKLDPCLVPSIVTGLEDELPLMSYFDLKRIRVDKNTPRFVHFDLGYKGGGDYGGLAMSSICDWAVKSSPGADGRFKEDLVPVVETDFAVGITAKNGDKVPLWKVREFVLALRDAGFNIELFTADMAVASEDTRQLLDNAGIETDYLSVDKNIMPYTTFKNLVFERRWRCHHHGILHFEMKHIEFDRKKGKYDHPEIVKDVIFDNEGRMQDVRQEGSKDILDAVVASTYAAVKAGKKPIDVEMYKKLLASTDKAAPSLSVFKPDWFIKAAMPAGQEVLVGEKQIKDKMAEQLRQLNALRLAGAFRRA